MTGWHPHPGPGTPAGPEDLYASRPPWDIADRWHVDSIEPATLDITTSPDGIRAWLTTITRP
jgi:hypothetical protein